MIHPVFDALLDLQKKAVTESARTWSRMFAVPRVSRQALRVRVGTTPYDVVYEEDTLQLYRYRRETPARFREPVLISYALVNRPYILDLQPDRSVVQQLLKHGFEVYLIDWGLPTAADRTLRLHDYVCGLLKNTVDRVLELSGVPALNLFGYCMGGTMSTMFTAVYPELVKNLILLAAPIEFEHDPGLLNLWTHEQYFDVDRFVDAFGNCPGSFLQGAFRLMKPVQNYVEKYLSFAENLDKEEFVENFFAMERWGRDNIPVAGETFREFVKCLYQRNELVKGQFKLNQVPVKLERITCPLLLLTADQDHLVPPASTEGIEPYVRSPEVKKMTIHAGHVGLVVSSKAHRKFWPEAADWIAAHSTAMQPS